MTNEDLAKKLEGVIKVTPSFDFLLLSGDKILKVVEGKDKLIVSNGVDDVERILVDAEEAPPKVISKWIKAKIPLALEINSGIISAIAFGVIGNIYKRDLSEQKKLSTYTYNWKEDYWFLKAEFSINLSDGDKVTAEVIIDQDNRTLLFDGDEISYMDFENCLKRFFIMTVAENIDNIDDTMARGLETL